MYVHDDASPRPGDTKPCLASYNSLWSCAQDGYEFGFYDGANMATEHNVIVVARAWTVPACAADHHFSCTHWLTV